MSAGDKIQCTCLTDAFVKMDDLIRQGYGVELEHNRRKTTITITETPKDDDA